MLISKYLDSQKLEALLEGGLDKIAKINDGFWKDIQIGDTLTFTDGKKEVFVEVKRKTFFGNFGEAWFTHGDRLLTPQERKKVLTMNDAKNLFRNWYANFEKDLCEHGVVVLSVNVLHHLNFRGLEHDFW